MSAFSDRLKAVVEEQKRTQGWVAARFNGRTGESFTSATIGRWINGNAEPRIEHIHALADVLKVSPAWLAFGQGSQELAAPAPETAPPQPPSREEVAGAMKKLNERTEPYRQAAARKKPKARGG